ncbi:MAG: hypothetical protein DRP09_18000 [Candidatus Thorarchaeota archaeon]|nr:MAG: hypothetical protein DRP09_18000 [Candidatus Thorarchaeota archaeon]
MKVVNDVICMDCEHYRIDNNWRVYCALGNKMWDCDKDEWDDKMFDCPDFKKGRNWTKDMTIKFKKEI